MIEGLPGAAFVLELSAIATVVGTASAYFKKRNLTAKKRAEMDVGLHIYKWTGTVFVAGWLLQLVLVLYL